MKVKIEEKAKDYIREKTDSNSIHIRIVRTGGWIGVYEPLVEMGKPSHEPSYDLYKVDDINIYLILGSKAYNNEINISLKKFLWFKNLEVEGLIINQLWWVSRDGLQRLTMSQLRPSPLTHLF